MWMKRSEGEVGWRREAGNGKRGAVGWHFKMTGVGLQPPLIASKGLKVGSRGGDSCLDEQETKGEGARRPSRCL